MMKKVLMLWLVLMALAGSAAAGLAYSSEQDSQKFQTLYQDGELLVETTNKPIQKGTDFRAVWVTHLTGDIPSYTGVTQYQGVINKVFEVMEYYHMNVMVFHIRTHNNALYKSSLNPVAGYYSTVNFDNWDPIAWIIEECHKRGMEFHAWLNPYRCSTTYSGTVADYAALQPVYNIASNPEYLLKTSNGILLNPGEPAVRQFLVDTCLEVMERYDVDAIHFDDYFYADGIDDAATKTKYNPENLSIADFRRQQVDLFIQLLSETMRTFNLAHDTCVQLGIAPTGVYRNDSNTTVTYDENGTLISPYGSHTGAWEHYGDYLYCDTKKWIDNEWIDYILPQSYWGFTHPVAGFEEVMSWWALVVKNKNVNLYSGMGIYMALSSGTYSWASDYAEAQKQIVYGTQISEIQGHCLFSYRHVVAAYDQTSTILYENMRRVKADNWTGAALLPEIRTYDSEILPSVGSIVVSEVTGGYSLDFQALDQAKFYAVYRSTQELTFSASEVIDVIGAGEDQTTLNYVDHVAAGHYYYGVKPMSANNTLGTPSVSSTDSTGHMVTFADFDGSILKTQFIEDGQNAVAPADPVRTGYVFTGWDHGLENITGNLTITAVYETLKLNIIFMDGETVLGTQTVDYGGSASLADPVKAGHVFEGWNKILTNITADLTVQAIFSPICYQVLFLDRLGLALKTELVAYGTTATAPTVTDEHFAGWDIGFSNVTSDLVVHSQFDNAFDLTFMVGEQVILEVFDVFGHFDVPAIPSKEGYDQVAPVWSLLDFSGIEADTIVTAVYQINTYTVVFKGVGGKVLATEIVDWQTAAPAPENVTEPGYEFLGWDTNFSSVTSNLTVTGEYEKTGGTSLISCENSGLQAAIFGLGILAWFILRRKRS